MMFSEAVDLAREWYVAISSGVHSNLEPPNYFLLVPFLVPLLMLILSRSVAGILGCVGLAWCASTSLLGPPGDRSMAAYALILLSCFLLAVSCMAAFVRSRHLYKVIRNLSGEIEEAQARVTREQAWRLASKEADEFPKASPAN